MVDKIEFELLQSQVKTLQKRINYLEFEIKNNYKKKKKKKENERFRQRKNYKIIKLFLKII